MKIKIILLLIAIPFLLAVADETTKAPACDSSGSKEAGNADTAFVPADHPMPLDASISQVEERGSGSKYDRINREKVVFLVCAGRYSLRADAERHLEALTKLGYSPKLKYDGQREYRVVLKKAKGISRAEKIKAQFQKSGLTCFIEEE